MTSEGNKAPLTGRTFDGNQPDVMKRQASLWRIKMFTLDQAITKSRAARALDLSLQHDGRGPTTMIYRRALAEWLDTGSFPKMSGLKSTPKAAFIWLEAVINGAFKS